LLGLLAEHTLELVLDANLCKLVSDDAYSLYDSFSGGLSDTLSAFNSTVEVLFSILRRFLVNERSASGFSCKALTVVTSRTRCVLSGNRLLFEASVLLEEVPEALVTGELHDLNLV
jgi:hypothetical protein